MIRILALACLKLIAATGLAVAADTSATRLPIAREVVRLIGVPDQLAQLEQMLADDIPSFVPSQTDAVAMQSRFRRQMAADAPAQLEAIAALYASRFTVEELTALRDFYRSPAGVKFVAEGLGMVEQTTEIAMSRGQTIIDRLMAEQGDAP